ncbi:DUF5676 family membrane protein [Aliiglaciecola sp. CAU 1673]|uniref:DUF5676 family membrane protein n=1 Tax=Aliiglaciecola sp. CAU 1673 TaxID=3032595 RepID=UPI0023DB73F0|nr:DUF5676 family membrane protein [Aliiglaciecola sp. CAU 1673]MDF2179886.1 DUF5676 family membrane protein [Aliiglaciecola sp. CAU 1673]
MKLSTLPFALAWAGAALVFYLVLAILLWLLPGPMNMMMHSDMQQGDWQMGLIGLLLGGAALAALFFVWGYLVAFFYNRING